MTHFASLGFRIFTRVCSLFEISTFLMNLKLNNWIFNLIQLNSVFKTNKSPATINCKQTQKLTSAQQKAFTKRVLYSSHCCSCHHRSETSQHLLWSCTEQLYRRSKMFGKPFLATAGILQVGFIKLIEPYCGIKKTLRIQEFCTLIIWFERSIIMLTVSVANCLCNAFYA